MAKDTYLFCVTCQIQSEYKWFRSYLETWLSNRSKIKEMFDFLENEVFWTLAIEDYHSADTESYMLNFLFRKHYQHEIELR